MPAKSADNPFCLDGKTALVTGAGRGIGRAVALALAAAGAELVLVSRTQGELDEAAAEIISSGGKAQPLPFDVTRSDAVRDAFAGLERLDILVNNAGLNRPQPFLEVDEPTLDLLLGLNVRAAFVVAQAAARLMVAMAAASSSTCRRRWGMSAPT
jgi:NAD(P)-dependent dehydrogenase (short-subunit alcohol dehydrogenase family)